MSFSYDLAQLQASPLFQVRRMVGDVNANTALLQDEEINLALTQRGNAYGAAAFLCRSLAAQFAREADVSDRDIRTALSQRSRNYLAMATDYEKQAEEPDDTSGASVLVAGLPAGFAIPGLSIPPQ